MQQQPGDHALRHLLWVVIGAGGGLLADRFSKRRLLMITQAAMALPAMAMFAIVVAGVVAPWMIFVLVFARGVVNAVDNPTRQSFAIEMVGPERVVNAVSLNSVLIHTARLVREWNAPPGVLRVINHPDGRNHGKGATVRRGMADASGRYRLFMDADNSTTLDHIETFWPWFDQGYDVVIGSRGIAGAHIVIHQPWHKELGGKIGNRIIRNLAAPGIADTQAGFKMFSARCIEDILPRLTIERWGFDRRQALSSGKRFRRSGRGAHFEGPRAVDR